MLKYYCDKCGEQLPAWTKFVEMFENAGHMYPERRHLLLCPNCSEKFEAWLVAESEEAATNKGGWNWVTEFEDFPRDAGHYECSRCRSRKPLTGPTNFCGNCGADMRKE